MALVDDLRSTVAQIFKSSWNTRNGQMVPESENLKLANDGVCLDATVLYADLDGSTAMVDQFKPEFSAEVYKAYLHCAAKIVRSQGGAITAYDGDRIMAVFIGDKKNSSAAETALRLNYAVVKIINPSLKAQYPKAQFVLRHVVGVDTSKLLVARTGVRGANDLVWVGRAANYAAKLTSLSSHFASRVTGAVFDRMNDKAKYASDGRLMWEQKTWTPMNKMRIYRSTWWRTA